MDERIWDWVEVVEKPVIREEELYKNLTKNVRTEAEVERRGGTGIQRGRISEKLINSCVEVGRKRI